ncbi:MAG: TonB family protein [Chitinophagales bacterium]|nr:TonB family protein [Chitinophagales bacterium]
MKKDKPYHSIRKPNFLGGKKAFHEFLEKNLVYPAEALQNNIQGTAHVKCEINDRGKVLKAESIHKLGYGLDEEAERLCLLMRFEDTTERGLKIKHTQTMKIPFVLPRQQEIKITYHTTPAPAQKKSTGYSYTIKI